MTKKIHKENLDSIAICNEMNDNSRNDKQQKTDLEMSPFFLVLFMTWCTITPVQYILTPPPSTMSFFISHIS